MLGINRLGAQGAGYYLADLARELPWAGDLRGGTAEWVGLAAAGLGVRGAVDPSRLQAVLDGRHPEADRRLRSDRASVLGFDLTFSAPKSVSVVFALGGPEVARRVLAAHQEGVRGAVGYVEAHALSSRRGSREQRVVVPATGLVAASFTHGVNRNLDPHLHTHVVAANLVHGLDGRWSACDQRGLFAHKRAAAAVYEAHLRAELSAHLGVAWDQGPGSRAEIAGVSPLLLGEFSSRSGDIRRHMAAWGSHSWRGAHVAWAATRLDKGAGATFAELSSQWARRAHALGSTHDELVASLGRRTAPRDMRYLDEHGFGAALSLAPDGAARRRDVVAAFSAAAVAGVPAQNVEQLVDLWVPPSPAGRAVGVAEDVHPLRRVVPGGHLLDALGPRPVDPVDHAVWREAAGVIDAYRSRWGVPQGIDALGAAAMPSGISSLPTPRLVDHLHAARSVEAARQRLGWHATRALEMGRSR